MLGTTSTLLRKTNRLDLFAASSSLSFPNKKKTDRTFATLPHKILILGSGWGGYSAAQKLAQSPELKGSEITVISPANHFVFTPLLPSTATGTLEFRTVQEPIREFFSSLCLLFCLK